MSLVKPVLASIVALAATIVLSLGVLADGATVQHFNLNSPQQCQTYYNFIFCYSSTGEMNAVQAASGNFSSEVNGTFAWSGSSNGVLLYSGSSAVHQHLLLADNFTVIKELGVHQTSTFTYGGTTCTFTGDVHVTDLNPYTGIGHFQYNNVTFVCV
ncbi:MAG: hypothetical protein PVS3B2_14150 [Candidatus Dormibacteraceae bacterium]